MLREGDGRCFCHGAGCFIAFSGKTSRGATTSRSGWRTTTCSVRRSSAVWTAEVPFIPRASCCRSSHTLFTRAVRAQSFRGRAIFSRFELFTRHRKHHCRSIRTCHSSPVGAFELHVGIPSLQTCGNVCASQRTTAQFKTMTPGIKLVSRFPKLPTRFRTWLWSVPKRITGNVFNVGNSSNMCSHKLVSQTSSGHWLFHMSVGSIGLLLVCDTDQQGAPCQTMTSCCCRFLQAWGTATIRLRATEGFFFGTVVRSCVIAIPPSQ